MAGWTSLAVLLWSDIGGIGKLVMQSELLPWPLVMLAVAFGSLFAILALAAAFLMLGDENDSASRRSRH